MVEIILLQQITYFAGLAADSPGLLRLAQTTIEESYEPGQLIVLEGEVSRGLYYLAEGRVRLYKSGRDGREQVLSIVRKGATFNETAVLDGGLVAANAEALETSIVWRIPTATINFLLDTEPTVARGMAQAMASSLRDLTELIGEISLKQVTARVARILLEQAEQGAIQGVGLSNEIVAQLTQQQMAAMAGTVREMIGRALRTLRRAGAVEPRRGYIVIRNQDKLRSFL